MKTIQLTQGKEVTVDDELYDKLSLHSWHFNNSGYARTSKPKKMYMHRMIMGFPKSYIDHINGDKLDNKSSNLRLCDASQNSLNQDMRSDNKSGVKGVIWDKNRKKWKAQLKFRGIYYLNKRFDNIEEATKAYQDTANEVFGEFLRNGLYGS